MKKETANMIKNLEAKYKDDSEALEIIKQAKTDVEYIEKQEEKSDYKGQPSKGKVMELEAFLHDWY